MDLTGQTLLGKYEVESLLGVGGMGAVWRARHALTGRKLAIKVLDEAYLKNDQVTRRFGREARVASSIQHPGIVEVLDLDQTAEGVPFLVMEFLEGETLASRIERRGRLQQEEIVRLGRMLLDALDAAHTHGVVHRDLKPENIYVVPAGRRGELVKILDFGISQMREEGEHKLTMTGSVLGTPHYMSPEQAMGEPDVDHRADVYAAGVVLYECAVGDVPFDAPNYNKLLRHILDSEPLPPRQRQADISDEVERVILWAMEKDRFHRLASAREMYDWLGRADAGEEVPYEPRPSSLPPEPIPVGSGLGSAAAKAAGTPRPVGGLPANPGVRSSLIKSTAAEWTPSEPPSSGGFDLDVDVQLHDAPVPDEEPGDWSVSPTLAQRAKAISSAPPPSAPSSVPPPRDLGDDPLTPSAGRALDLELDETALRASKAPPSMHPPSRQTPAVGTASSSGQYRAVSSPGSLPAGSSPGSVSAPHSVPPHSIPPRVADLSGRFDAVEEEEAPERPAWVRFALWGGGALVLFVGLVLAVRWVVDPGVEDEVVVAPPVVTAPAKNREPEARGPSWVSIRVEGLPPAASMRLDGLPVTTPFRVREGGEHVVEISAPGYEDRRIEFDADRNRTLVARMRPAVGAVQAP
ncbi:MAG: hypothetical protein SangKO_015860 [Sandaracinaceae bacterium]